VFELFRESIDFVQENNLGHEDITIYMTIADKVCIGGGGRLTMVKVLAKLWELVMASN